MKINHQTYCCLEDLFSIRVMRMQRFLEKMARFPARLRIEPVLYR